MRVKGKGKRKEKRKGKGKGKGQGQRKGKGKEKDVGRTWDSRGITRENSDGCSWLIPGY